MARSDARARNLNYALGFAGLNRAVKHLSTCHRRPAELCGKFPLTAPHSRRSNSGGSYLVSWFRGIAKLLFLAVITTGILFTLQNCSLRDKYVYSRAAASLKRGVNRKIVASNTPSAFDRESAMSPNELMDRWNPLIAVASRRFGVSEAWIRAVTRMESGGRTMLEENRPITSSPGAMGIMQLMPRTYKQMREKYRLGANPYDPQDNVFAGTAYLRWLYRRYGYPAMFAGYNAGPGKLNAHLQRGRPLPTETNAYVSGIASILGTGPRQRIRSSTQLARLTQPDGSPIWIDAAAVVSIRRSLSGEFACGVQSVISVRKLRQGVRENVAKATAILRDRGGRV